MHARVVKSIALPALKKMLWNLNPSQGKLYMNKRHASSACPLCSGFDSYDHYLKCPFPTDHKVVKTSMCEFQTRASKNGVPDHLIRNIVRLSKGLQPDLSDIPRTTIDVYRCQTRVGWNQFMLGRVVAEWSEVRRAGQEVNKESVNVGYLILY